MPNYCAVCGRSKATDTSISLYRIPKEPELRKRWLDSLGLSEDRVTADSRVCSKHFRDGNPKNVPSVHIGERFSDRPTCETPRGKRRASREVAKQQLEQHAKRRCIRTHHSVSPSALLSSTPTPATSPSPSPLSPPLQRISSPASPHFLTSSPVPHSVSVRSSRDCSETSSLSLFLSEEDSPSVSPLRLQSQSEVQVTVDAALSAQIQMLKAQVAKLQVEVNEARQAPFRVEHIAHDDSLISLYTGLPSYDVLLSSSLGQLSIH